MKTWLHHHSYAFKTAIRRLSLTPFSTITNIIVIAFVLSLPLVVSAIITSLAPVTQVVSVNPVITLFMKNTTNLDSTKELSESLQKEFASSIDKIEVVSKQEALDSLRSSKQWADSLNALSNNPLPHSIIITLASNINTEQANQLANQWGDLEPVDMVQFDSDWLKKLEGILHFFKVLLGILAIGVGIIVIATIFNTVRMQALLQRDEIAVARLVGATESFVRRPFLYLGAITGLFAGLLAIVLTIFGLSMMNDAILVLSESYGQSFSLNLPSAFWLILAIILVMFIAALSARWSVTKHSKF
ncbi:permease [Pelistega indica]|uniref:Cell division protein FtsX n=1 Tax=Pelistega indica TaxID=1414851 RepID=V8FXN4_9BURK|nr:MULTISPECIES: ABC transporter permease [Pelistega]ETD68935.1 permease [Pelistega indica]